MVERNVTLAANIRRLREAVGETQGQFAARFGVEQPTVSRWERAISPPERKYLAAMADLAGVDESAFVYRPTAGNLIPVVGYAAGGEEWSPVDDYAPGDGMEPVELGLGDADPIAIMVRGESMAPVYRNGDVLICSRQRGTDLTAALNRDCVVRTADGRCYIKFLVKGSRAGRFRLRSYNLSFPDLEDQALDWAAPVIWVKRGR
jgi:transcriptional regulator with XRE-family HTH domain